VIRFIAYGEESFKRILLFGALSPSQLSLSIFIKIQTLANHAKSQRAVILLVIDICSDKEPLVTSG
jgi:hypothetical protein